MSPYYGWTGRGWRPTQLAGGSVGHRAFLSGYWFTVRVSVCEAEVTPEPEAVRVRVEVTGGGGVVPPPVVLDPQPLAAIIMDEAASRATSRTERFLRRNRKGARNNAASAISPRFRSSRTLEDAAAVCTETLIGVVVVAGVTLSGLGWVQVSPAGAPVQVNVRVPV